MEQNSEGRYTYIMPLTLPHAELVEAAQASAVYIIMVFISVLASSLAGYLVCSVPILLTITEASPINQRLTDKLISGLGGLLSTDSTLNPVPTAFFTKSLYQDDQLSNHEVTNPLKHSIPHIVISMEEDRVSKTETLRRYQRSPKSRKTSRTIRPDMSSSGGKSRWEERMRKPKGIFKREAQMPQSGMPAGMPEMPSGSGDMKQGMSEKMPDMNPGMGMPSPPTSDK